MVKSKSMTTEELDFNEKLEEHHLQAVETDLGEYIMQLAHERPYHIVAPALNKTRYDVAELFQQKLGVENETVIEKQTMIARAVLREKFLAADIGVSGGQFPDRGFGRGGAGRERRQYPAHHFGAEDSHRGGRHREDDPAGAGPGGVPEAAGAQRHRDRRSPSIRLFFPARGARARSTARRSSTFCCWTTAAPSCWPIARSGSRSTAFVAARV